jgi:PAS domain S-box-containing protein
MEMTSAQTSRFRRSAAQYFFGGIGLALLTFVCLRLELGLATTGFLYLVLITLLSLAATYIESAILSVIAVACLNYFFTQPLFEFKVGTSQDVVLVIAFLLTALGVTRLVGSARKQARALRRSEANLAEAQRLSRTGSFGWHVSSGEILWSEETFRIFQYVRTTRPTVKLIVQRTHPEDRALVQRTIERASQDGKDFDFEHRLLMPDGFIKYLHVIGHAEGDKCGQCEFVGAVMDVTAAKEAEEKIRQNEMELRITLETIPTFVVSTLPDGSVDFVSQSWLHYLGRTKEEILGWSWVQVVHPEDLDTLLNNWQTALAAGEPLETETRIRRADGKYRWFLARAVPLFDGKGNIVKWYATTHDIDDRKQAEQKLRQSEAYLSEAQRLSLTGSASWNVASGEIVWSEETFRIFQCDRTTKPTLELIRQRTHPQDRALVQQTMERASQDGKDIDFEHRLLMPDDSVKYLHAVSHPVFNPAGDLVEYVGTVMDVTEHKRVAEVLRRSKNRFQAMVEKNAEGILLILPEKRIVYASPAVERVLGYTAEQLTMQSLIEHIHLDYRQHATDSWNRLLQDPEYVAAAETMLQHKDGSWRWIESTARNLLREPSVQAVVVNFRDITERKRAQAERERLEQRLRQAAKMEAVGRLAGGIAHDFNNVLAGVFAYGEMLVEETSAGSPLKRYAQNVLIAATRGRGLVEQILAYSHSQRGKRAPVDIARVFAETLELLRGSLPTDIRLEASVPQRPLVVIGDATQLHQVVMNLCSNAIQAMSGGGTLRVALETTDVSAERALSHGTLAPGRYVRLTVEDNGSGMDEATLSRIFEPFFTTKEIGQGTGLGLALVYAIVTDSGGAIDVKSAPKQGSTFTIYGPLAEVALGAADDTAAAPPRGNGERVLLVDDEASLLAATAEVLMRLGYEPVSFSDGQAALAAFEAAPGRFDVVVADEVMPGLTGTGLASVLHRRRADLPIVLVSGYSGPILTQQALAAGVSELLTKPLQSRQIATTLARVLHRVA